MENQKKTIFAFVINMDNIVQKKQISVLWQ